MTGPRLAVVCGALAGRPGRAGHGWVFLQWLLGLQCLGWEVLFIDRVGDDGVPNSTGADRRRLAAVGWEWIQKCLNPFGLAGRYAMVAEDGEVVYGIPRQDIEAAVRQAELLLDFNGYLRDQSLLDLSRLSVFVDIDPGFPQMWSETGLHQAFGFHDAYVTVGTNLGQPGCSVPTCGLRWIGVHPPVVLPEWPVTKRGRRFTTVATWRGAYDSVAFRGQRYGLRAHQLRRYLDLPGRSAVCLEMALDIGASDESDRRRLVEHGWGLTDPAVVAGDPLTYRSYIQQSRGEIQIPKDMYVRSRSGWFSDRSACYLSTGRPVVMVDTGVGATLPIGEGLLCFSDPDEAARSLAEVEADYPRHAQAARRIAEDHLDSRHVIGGLLDALGCG